jgi:hypothetical protein
MISQHEGLVSVSQILIVSSQYAMSPWKGRINGVPCDSAKQVVRNNEVADYTRTSYYYYYKLASVVLLQYLAPLSLCYSLTVAQVNVI